MGGEAEEEEGGRGRPAPVAFLWTRTETHDDAWDTHNATVVTEDFIDLIL